MKQRTPLLPLPSRLLITLTTLGTLALTGCGVGVNSIESGGTTAAVSGMLHGGPNPIIGAAITLYATQNNGYGGAGLKLASTTTDGSGSFSFNPPTYTCPAGQQAYLVAAGGNTGGNASNPNSLMLAAIGDCSSLGSSTYIWLDELTTVAAGYALSNFITISGTTVNISAPANNNAATPSCTGTGASMTCTAAGLKHAFQNAANLVNAVGTASAIPTGLAYANTPSNVNGYVPQPLINLLGNILQICVNSLGGSAGDGSACGTLFTNTTPPVVLNAAAAAPTNTLQAVVNLAKYPTAGNIATPNLFSLAPSNGFYLPALTAAPSDYSLAVLYRIPTAGGTFATPFFATTDYADNVYAVGNSGASGAAYSFAAANTSNGTSLWSSAALGGNTQTCVSTTGLCIAATDTIGHLYVTDINSTAYHLYLTNTIDGTSSVITTASGVKPFAVVVDKFNDAFFSSTNTTATNLYEVPVGTTTPVAVSVAGVSYASGNPAPGSLTLDGSGNLYLTNQLGSPATTTTSTVFLQNTGGSTTETFANPAVVNTFSTAVGAQAASTVIDAAGNAWTANATTLYEEASGASSAPLLTKTISDTTGAGAAGSASTVRLIGIDGDGTIILPDASSSRVFIFYPGTQGITSIQPCYTAGATTCTNGAPGARNVVVDSTGSLWFAGSTAPLGVVQLIGTAAPAWPQASYGKPGVRPH